MTSLWEPYLNADSDFSQRRSVSRIRSSSHQLHVETGRYVKLDRTDRICRFCSTENLGSHIEDEDHILNTCKNGEAIRRKYEISLKTLLDPHPVTCGQRSFNIAATYPSYMLLPKATFEKVIALSCRTIHLLYEKTTRFNKDLDDHSS